MVIRLAYLIWKSLGATQCGQVGVFEFDKERFSVRIDFEDAVLGCFVPGGGSFLKKERIGGEFDLTVSDTVVQDKFFFA
jgi:hypothetical protein